MSTFTSPFTSALPSYSMHIRRQCIPRDSLILPNLPGTRDTKHLQWGCCMPRRQQCRGSERLCHAASSSTPLAAEPIQSGQTSAHGTPTHKLRLHVVHVKLPAIPKYVFQHLLASHGWLRHMRELSHCRSWGCSSHSEFGGCGGGWSPQQAWQRH